MTCNGGTGTDLDTIFSAGIATWPEFQLTAVDLQTYATRTGLDESALQHSADVVLVCACLKGVAAAVNVLDRTIRDHVPTFVKRIDRDAEFANDVCQRLQERLLGGAPPRLATYSGAGPLVNWLRVMAVRLAVDA